MAQDPPAQDLMRYEAMAQDALRGVVKTALKRAAEPQGLPGAHHFYITFKTDAPGVSGPPDLLGKYPDEMTIVLQHQYWDLAVEPDRFSVMLKFGGVPKVLTPPFNAITRFEDPAAQFLLQFEPPRVADQPAAEPEPMPAPKPNRPRPRRLRATMTAPRSSRWTSSARNSTVGQTMVRGWGMTRCSID